MVRDDSIAKKVYDLWIENPYWTAKKICKKVELDYKQHGNYVNKLLSHFRSYHKFGSPQKAHLPKHRVFEWENIPRSELPGEGSLSKRLKFWGWREVSNRNDMWTYKDKNGRGNVHWYKGGLVRLYLDGELRLARAKELFCRAFSWMKPQELSKYLDVPLKEVYKKWTFEMGVPIPRFDIRTFERSHGIRIFADESDPRAIHVGESTPFWIDEQRQATAELSETVKQFGLEIQEHMKLIKLWQKEAKQQRAKPKRHVKPKKRKGS
jgi:hypothetical protein